MYTMSDGPNGDMEKRKVCLSRAIQTNDLDEMFKYRDLCGSDILLPKYPSYAKPQVQMPAIALALECVCSAEMNALAYNHLNDSNVITWLVTKCGVDPNAPFRINGKTRPFFETRGYTEPEEKEDANFHENHTPLSLLLSYYIKYRSLDEMKILNCMEQLMRCGADPSVASYIREDGVTSSLLMAALLNRYVWNRCTVDFFKYFLEHGAKFFVTDKAPLATYFKKNYIDEDDVLVLFNKFSMDGQITEKDILEPIMIRGVPRDAMYIWCTYEPRKEDVISAWKMNWFLSLGFNPQSGFDGIRDGLEDRLHVFKSHFHLHYDLRRKYDKLQKALRIAVENGRSYRMRNVHIAQLFERMHLPEELGNGIAAKSGVSNKSMSMAWKKVQEHNWRNASAQL